MKRINNKKGFTLVELLAVIAILAILVLIAVPNVLRMYRNARKDTFATEAKSLYQTVMKQNFLTSNTSQIYNTGSLDITGGADMVYSIATNQQGAVTCFQVADNEYMWIYRNKGIPLSNEDDIAKDEEIAQRDTDVIFDCSGDHQFDITVPATFATAGGWWPSDFPKESIERIIFTYSYNSKDYDKVFFSDDEKVGGLETYVKDNIAYVLINRNKRKNKAIKMPADSSNTFAGFTGLKNVSGLKLLDFSGVTNMDNFFGNAPLTYINGYESFNTSKVKSAKNAFAGVKVSNLNLSNWNMQSLEDATGMFSNTGSSYISLAGWNVSKVTKYNNMFANNSKLTTVSLAGWNTNPNADFTGMFNNCPNLLTITTDSGFKVGNTNVSMFTGDTKLSGGSGTTYSNDKSLYARLDASGTPGYLSSSTTDGVVSAKLYNSGTVSGSYTDLTANGSVPPDWDYYNGPRLLEIDLFSMKNGNTKTLDITVPAGMYIVKDSWTKSGKEISNVTFTKLANQGTGSYTNNETGTLHYTFNSSATTSSVQMLVMFDRAIWDKNKKNATEMGTDNMTLEPPVVVNFNNGSTVRKIANIHSATSIGKSTYGYSFYTYNNNSTIFVDTPTLILGSTSFLSTDQSSFPYFYKKITFETYATFTNESGQTVYAQVGDASVPSYLNSINSTGTTDKIYKGEWTNIYSSGGLSLPRLKYTVNSSDKPKSKSKLTVYLKESVTTLSGQTRTLSKTLTYDIKSKDLDITDLAVSSSNKTVPKESYYEESGYSDVAGIFTMYNKGYNDISDVKVVYEYDTGTAVNTPPVLKVMAARPFLENGQQVNAKITIINKKGEEKVVQSYPLKSTSTTNGSYVSASSVASSLGLTGLYYLKKIEYTIPKVSGTKGTNPINYFYHSQGSGSQSSGGNFIGVSSGKATSKCSIYYENKLVKTVTSTTNVTDTPAFSGYISKINTPLGTNFTAGDNIELAINVASVSYPYTNTQAFSKPEVYLVLPFGINIESVAIGNSANMSTSDATPVVSKIKTITIGDVLNNVYKITTANKTWFGYLNVTSTGAVAGQYASKWVRVKLNTDISMEYTSINLRDSVYFKDAMGHISIGGSYAKNTVADPYDVDNDKSTSDKYGVIDNATQTINIYAGGEDE